MYHNIVVRNIALLVLVILAAASVVIAGNDTTVDFDPFGSGPSGEQSESQYTTDTSPIISQLQLNNSDISEVFQIIRDKTGWSIFPSAEVSRAKISLMSSDITAQQLLDMVVILAGFTYHREGDIISVMTYDEYIQNFGLAKEVVTLINANADSVAVVIKPFLSKLGKCVVHKETNKLVVFESGANLRTIVDVIQELDVPVEAQTVIKVVELQFMDAQELAAVLQNVFTQEQFEYNPTINRRPNNSMVQPETRITEPETIQDIPLMTPKSQVGIYAIARTNQLIIKAQKTDMEELLKLVEELDTYTEPTTRSYQFVYVDASEVYNGLEELLNIPSRTGRYGGTARQSRSEGGRPGGVTLVTKTNSILLTAPPSVHRIMDSIVKSVDMPGMYEAGMIRSYRIQNANVDEIAGAIRELVESRGRTDREPGEPQYERAPDELSPEPDMSGLEQTEEYVPQVEARVTVSKSTNSVIILATARQHRELEKLIAELDVRRKQVLIKAMIIEVTTTDDMDFGIELDFFDGGFLSFTSFGLSTIDPDTGIRDIVVSPGGTAAVIKPNKVQAILNALQGNDNVRIESTPQVLVNDNAVGTIQSIAEQPTRQTNQGETTTTTSFGEYVTAGTQFFVTPHISDSDYLHVQYQIMLNSFGEQADPELPPARNTSTIQSEATVPDGSTIIVGGIQSSSKSESVDKVPILGDIPLFGLLFRNTTIRKQYVTTYLFITTTIIKSEDFSDLQDASEEAMEKVREEDRNRTNDAQAEKKE